MDLKVLNVDSETGRISFMVQNSYVEGLDLLVQMVVLDLLSSEGSDVLDPDLGTGIPDLIGGNVDQDNLSELAADISSKVSKTQTRILLDQVGVDIPLEERLRKITVISVTPGDSEDRIDIRLRVENEAGRTSNVVL